MKPKKSQKYYIYERDGKRCLYCGKMLRIGQASMDHYLPKSRGGPDDLFNLVLSCKRCNKEKMSRVPGDFSELMVSLFKKGVEDKKIIGKSIEYTSKQLQDMVKEVNKLEDICRYTVFQSQAFRFFVKDNRVVKVVRIGNFKSL